MTSGLFASYEDDFNESSRQVRAAATALQESLKQNCSAYEPPPATGPQSRAHHCQVMQQGLAHMRELVTSMLYESNDVEAGEARSEARRRVEDYKRVVTVLEGELFRLRQESQDADRMDLITGGNDALDDATLEARTRMLGNTQKLRQGTTTLERAERALHAASDLGTSTLSTLRAQTETMRNFNANIHGVDAEVMESRRIVNQMQRTATKRKLCLIGVILALIFCVVGLVFLR
ncbi:vesicle transport v-SNARE 11 [Trypanosoma conorhini]|uniref:Vesicle transport v-SNARE 11 n=1 Tax=Trypanosoma conorhini TaxID=83891 RepID=A0A3R7N7L7_9TRYP|nr:vesicle transport v-SNARE 11 [Trypanosoma conorhini]RNF17547.1 vesicle transport v-SNARE 11 [Trypanosoma conorhini]